MNIYIYESYRMQAPQNRENPLNFLEVSFLEIGVDLSHLLALADVWGADWEMGIPG